MHIRFALETLSDFVARSEAHQPVMFDQPRRLREGGGSPE
jgi:hypothetical protein